MAYHVLTCGEAVLVTTANPYAIGGLGEFAIHEMDGPIPDLNVHAWDFAADAFVKSDTKLTHFAFLSRFSMAERIAIRASIDPVVIDMMQLMDAAEYVDMAEPATQQGVGYLASVGLIAAGRVAEILA